MTPGIRLAILGLLFMIPIPAHAGLHYSGEPFADLPSQWRGFLADLRALRGIAIKPTPMLAASPMRLEYEEAAKKLQEAARERGLSVDEQADLGAVLIRLGDIPAAIKVLHGAQRAHPKHYAVNANLGTAWQLSGDLEQAARCLEMAVELAPGKRQSAEQMHLSLVRLRLRQARDSLELDDLFGIRFVGESGQFEPGKLAAAERRKLTSEAVALTQQLVLWLPHDTRLLWQLGELANAHGDLATASSILEMCVGQFALSTRTLREHRLAVRAALEKQDKSPPGSEIARTEHAGHAGLIAPKSRRPLAVKRLDPGSLAPISKDGINPVPWALLMETTMDRQFKPTFPRYLQELKDLHVSLTGFMQPLTDDLELNAFMLVEYPTGCWYCEMPEVTGIALVELPEGKNATFTRNMVKISGKLFLNDSDPENFLYTIREARISEAD
jgi:hypothetical protein